MSKVLWECPHCECEDLETGDAREVFRSSEPELIRTVTCNECKEEWTEVYRCVEVTD